MPIIQRSDKAIFLYQCYRETITLDRFSWVRQQITQLSDAYGPEVILQRRSDNTVEAIFSHDSGYVLAETIWQYFGKPRDLIFCEEHPSDTRYFFIVVRDGRVVQDELIELSEVIPQIQLQLLESPPIVLHIPQSLPMDSSLINHTNILECHRHFEAVLPKLPLNFECKTGSVTEAIATAKLKRLHPYAVALLCMLWFVGFIYVWDKINAHDHNKPHMTPLTYARELLERPSIDGQLLVIRNLLTKTALLPGWTVGNLTYNGKSVSMEAHSEGGTATQLVTWATAHGMDLTFTDRGAVLALTPILPNRPPIGHVPNNTVVLAQIIDAMLKIIPNKSVFLGHSTAQFGITATSANIEITDVSPNTLLLMARFLSTLPIRLQQVTLHVDEGLVTGKVAIEMIGR